MVLPQVLLGANGVHEAVEKWLGFRAQEHVQLVLHAGLQLLLGLALFQQRQHVPGQGSGVGVASKMRRRRRKKWTMVD